MNDLNLNLEIEEETQQDDSPLLLVTRKVLVQAADRFMANAVGIYNQDDVFKAVRTVADSASKKLLLDEISWGVAIDRIKARSKPRMKNNDDWIGYGEMAITLPEKKIVNVFYASSPSLEHRKNNVVENRDRIVKSSEEEISRINELQSMMVKIRVDTAGPAIKVLASIAAKKKKWNTPA